MTSSARWRAGGASGTAALLLGVLALGCGSSGAAVDAGRDAGGRGGAGGDAGGGGADAGPSSVEVAGDACSGVIASHADEGAFHIACTTPTSFGTTPPSSGNHYDVWPDFHAYSTPLPWGNLMHAMEHGAVVVVYNCPGGCPDEVARAQAVIDAQPADPLCTAPDVRRVILAPDPTLDVRWAAAAWTWTLRADCFDERLFGGFIADHYGQGLEATCYELHYEPSQFCPGAG